MNAGPSSDRPEKDDLDPRHEAVERLLARAPMPEPDAWFAARTLARCRSEKLETVSLTRVWRWVLGSGLGVCLAVGLLVVQVKQVAAPVTAPSADQQKSVQEAFEIMASSDNSDNDATSPSASSTSWQDSSL